MVKGNVLYCPFFRFTIKKNVDNLSNEFFSSFHEYIKKWYCAHSNHKSSEQIRTLYSDSRTSNDEIITGVKAVDDNDIVMMLIFPIVHTHT